MHACFCMHARENVHMHACVFRVCVCVCVCVIVRTDTPTCLDELTRGRVRGSARVHKGTMMCAACARYHGVWVNPES